MRGAHDAPPGSLDGLEGCLGLDEVVECGVGVVATATASLYFLLAWYCSALPPRCIFLHICLWPRRQWSIWQVLLQYLVSHLTHRGACRASGAAHAGHIVRIIFTGRRGIGVFARRDKRLVASSGLQDASYIILDQIVLARDRGRTDGLAGF